MKTVFKATAIAAFATLAIAAGSAQAAVTVSHSLQDTPLPAGHQLVWDFDGYQAVGYGLSLSGGAAVFNGADGLQSGVAAPPPGTNSLYLAVLGGGQAVLTTPMISALSIYMGSPDDYNSILFNYSDGTSESLTGQQLADGAFGGNQSVGRRMFYTFDKSVTSVVFSSSQNSFEFDNIATTSAVPEPATWAMMITGFGLAGSALRTRRRQVALATA